MKPAFNGGGSVRGRRWWGVRKGNGEVTMGQASAFDGGNGQIWALEFDIGNGRQL